MEVWDADVNADDMIDNFTFPMNMRLNKFNSSNSLTVGYHDMFGKLTLSYGNLTAVATSCTPTVQPTLSIDPCAQEGNSLCA